LERRLELGLAQADLNWHLEIAGPSWSARIGKEEFGAGQTAVSILQETALRIPLSEELLVLLGIVVECWIVL
jgi:hypothetical protein